MINLTSREFLPRKNANPHPHLGTLTFGTLTNPFLCLSCFLWLIHSQKKTLIRAPRRAKFLTFFFRESPPVPQPPPCYTTPHPAPTVAAANPIDVRNQPCWHWL